MSRMIGVVDAAATGPGIGTGIAIAAAVGRNRGFLRLNRALHLSRDRRKRESREVTIVRGEHWKLFRERLSRNTRIGRQRLMVQQHRQNSKSWCLPKTCLSFRSRR